jgi:hypothetical protein
MNNRTHFSICPPTVRAALVLLPVALAIATAGCNKKAPAVSAPPTPTNEQAASQTPQALVGEVDAAMTTQLRIFVQKKGRLPADFRELATTQLDLVPRTPPGKTWAIDPATQEVKLVNK